MHAGYTVLMWRMEHGVFSVPATLGTEGVCAASTRGSGTSPISA